MKIQNLFFDCFGTLIHFDNNLGKKKKDGHFIPSSDEDIYNLLKKSGNQRSLDDINKALQHSWQLCEKQYGAEYKECSSYNRFGYFLDLLEIKDTSLIPSCVSTHLEYMLRSTKIDKGLSSLLEDLSQTYKLSLVSNFNWQTGLERIVAFHKLTSHFSHILSSEFLGYRKPGKLFFEKALELTKSQKKQTIYIGDTIRYDEQGAINSNLPVVIIGKEGANSKYPYIHSINELKTYLSKKVS